MIDKKIQTRIDKALQHPLFNLIGKTADELGMETYVVGGFVRDIFLQRPSKDIDVVTVGSGIELAKKLQEGLGKKAKLSVFTNFGTAQVKYKEWEVELVGARKESYQRHSRKPIVEDGSLEDDQKRRDFTINAMAISLNKERWGEVIDPFNGISDILKQRIVTPLDPNITFSDDPLRMLRAVRFASRFGFSIDPVTIEAIKSNRQRLEIVSGERIVDELNKIMASDAPADGITLLDDCLLLDLIIPELTALKGVETKKGQGHKDNFRHSLQVLHNIKGKSDNLWLRWAALLHDIGKPRTKRWEPRQGWTFHNHNFIGMKMVPPMFKRMKMPQNEHMKFVQKMVDLHMRPIALVEEEVTDSAVRRLLFEAGDDIDNLMQLCEADITSKNEVKVERYLHNFQQVRLKLVDIEEKDRVRNFQPPVSGNEIMEWYHLEPCPLVGELKMALKEAVLDGIIPNEREAAVTFINQKAKKLGLQQNDSINK